MLEREIDAFILEHPEEAHRLLQAYRMLIGDTQPWWRVTEYGNSRGWESAVKSAITHRAIQCHIPAKALAFWMNLNVFPKARASVLQEAIERFIHGSR